MEIDEMKALLKTKEYDFLRTNEHLGKNIILLTLGGSHAYGTNNKDSDLDIRGIAINSKRDILLGHDFNQVDGSNTDTVIYSLRKIVSMLSNCNPNTIEILGCKPEHYLHTSVIGKSLLENRHMFLSQRAIGSFAGYANEQLRKLENATVRDIEQKRREEHILKTIMHAWKTMQEKYQQIPDCSFKLYLDKAVNKDFDEEIFMDVNNLYHYPLRDYRNLWNEMNNIVKSYNKIGKRNENALTHGKIAKHAMHLLRLFIMCIDILEKEEIVTYRENEHELLMNIRNGEFLGEDNVPSEEFYEIVNEYEKKMEYAAKHTSLPLRPDQTKIDEWMYWANNLIVSGKNI